MEKPTKPPTDWKPIFQADLDKQRDDPNYKPPPYKTWRPKRRKKSSFKE
jgi:hypothetical protein